MGIEIYMYQKFIVLALTLVKFFYVFNIPRSVNLLII